MIGRFLLGAGLGGLVGTGLLAMASLVGPPPAPLAPVPTAAPEIAAPASAPASVPDPEPIPAPVSEPAPETKLTPETEPATPAPAPEASAPVTTPAETAPDPVPAPDPTPVPPTPVPPTPAPDQAAALPEVPPAMPEVAPETATEAPMAPAAPEGQAEDGTAVAQGAAPQLPATPAPLPAPGTEAAPSPLDAPAAAPDLAAGPAPAAPAVPVPPEGTAEAPGSDVAPGAPADPAALAVAAPEEAPPGVEPPAPPPLTPEEEALLAEIAANGPGTALPPGDAPPELVPPAETAPEPTPEAESALPEILSPPDTADPAAVPADDAARVTVGQGGSTLPPPPAVGEDVEGITTDRLPRIGDAPAAEAGGVIADDRPIVRNARPFENPAGKPVFSIILIDTGEDALDRAALADLPFPVTFAIDPLAPGAANRAAIYRDAGQEVVMLATGLPLGAAASDVEVAFQAMFMALPQAVAVLDPPGRLFQNDRGLASFVVPVVGGQGLGVITWEGGLNAADQVARREDVPAAVAFRNLDADGEATTVIRRYLDRAAFKAAQEGRVTVIGSTRSETVAALLEWAVEGRAATVALAPVTAVMSVD